MLGSFEWGRIYGIPIKVHVTLIILLPIIAMQFGLVLGTTALFWGLLGAAGLFASVALHELGHSVVALSKGIRVREILLLPIGGIARLENMPERARDELHIAVAGPLVSLALAMLLTAAGGLIRLIGLMQFAQVLRILGFMNLFLALFNLLPSFPMDGGRIFRAVMTPRLGRVEATRIAVKIGRFMAILFGLFAILPPLNLFLLAIAVFIYMAAGSEYRMVLMQEAHRRVFAPWDYREDLRPPEKEDFEVRVSPPPYARRKTTTRNLFDDLFRNS